MEKIMAKEEYHFVDGETPSVQLGSNQIVSDAAPISFRCVCAYEWGAFNLHKVVIGRSKWRTIFQIIDDTQHKDREASSVSLTRGKPASFVCSFIEKKDNEKRDTIYARNPCLCCFESLIIFFH